jgi:hypothetical protein
MREAPAARQLSSAVEIFCQTSGAAQFASMLRWLRIPGITVRHRRVRKAESQGQFRQTAVRRARAGSVKQFLNGVPISCSRVEPVSASICWLTSVMTPSGSVVISASILDSISERA